MEKESSKLVKEDRDDGQSESEASKKKKVKEDKATIAELFQFTDFKEKVMVLLGCFSTVAFGVAKLTPAFFIGKFMTVLVDSAVFNDFAEDSRDYLLSVNLTVDDAIENADRLLDRCDDLEMFYHGNRTCDDLGLNGRVSKKLSELALIFLITACSIFLSRLGGTYCWSYAAKKQALKIRLALLKNVLSQDIGWFDCQEPGEISCKLSEDITKIEEAISIGFGTILDNVTVFIAAITLSFVTSWKLSLAILGVTPALFLAGHLMLAGMGKAVQMENKAYAKAGAVAEEVLGAIKTVVAFDGQEKECQRYRDNVESAEKAGIRKSVITGLSYAIAYGSFYITYAVSFGYGATLVRHGHLDPGEMYTVYWGMSNALTVLGLAGSSLQVVTSARISAYSVFKLIHQKSPINSTSDEGLKPSRVTGAIRIKDVHFTYPARPEAPILRGLNLSVKAGQSVALVGSSGCGKSTIAQLLQRFYDPQQGQIMLDGTDLRHLNVRWLRQNIGIVSQEPVLFDGTILDNIKHGSESATTDQIHQAAKSANAYNFIMDLPEKFKTLVGQRGTQLSGGQKQRIAIARALVGDPKILLLDEATSALDNESESIVQNALDEAREGRTTIMIAHRLSTIRNADFIVSLDKGVVVEQGDHGQLMEKEGIYYTLVTNQTNMETEQGETQKRTGLQRKLNEENRGLANPEEEVVSTEEKKVESSKKDVILRTFRVNASQWPCFLLGAVGCICSGGTNAFSGLLIAKFVSVFSEDDEDEQKDKILLYSMLFLAGGGALFLFEFLRRYMFGRAGESLSKILRIDCFDAIMRQEMGWFDRPENSIGALGTRLAVDATQARNITGTAIANLGQGISCIVIGITICMVLDWKMTLKLLGIYPFLIVGFYGKFQIISVNYESQRMAIEKGGKVAVEAIDSVRTVASLGIEDTMLSAYKSAMTRVNSNAEREALRTALIVAFCYAAEHLYFSYAVYLFGKSIEGDNSDSSDGLALFAVLLNSANGVWDALSFGPDLAKGTHSAQQIYSIVDRIPEIDVSCVDGAKPRAGSWTSRIKFNDAKFFYPVRPSVQVLQGLSISVDRDQTLALVGSSGCGKSTIISILERFYKISSGTVLIDKYKIEELNVQWLRSQIGLVSQEPVLFACTIRENIAYGDNFRDVPMDEIIKAAKLANIHNFIEALPQGYDTQVGGKGTHLSGGQKQRVAIARALVRNPKILLLDEATSALDTESEKIVRDALDRARKGRTCITIAHRLSSIRDVDKIIVIKSGRAEEEDADQRWVLELGWLITNHASRMVHLCCQDHDTAETVWTAQLLHA